MNIPDDVMAIAHDLSLTGCGCDEDASHECPNMNGYCRYQETAIARAILSERESATKAERERCAERFEKAATLQGRQECCGFPTSAHECCADPLYMISDRDGARAIRNGADFVPAITIRKGDGE